MRVRIASTLLSATQAEEAESILRACVHCGFCNATCPTYQELGDERDGPRGRIYQIKSLLEGQPPSAGTRAHLDRCLTCRACETTCPSGVRYGRLLDLARPPLEQALPRHFRERVLRWGLRKLLPTPWFGRLLRAGQAVRRLLPATVAARVPQLTTAASPPPPRYARRWLALPGCVQSAVRPSINAAAGRLLEHCRQESLIEVRGCGCCGALAYHLGAHEEARAHARANLDAWSSALERGAPGVLSTASGCTAFLREYGELLHDDPVYAARAAALSACVRDPVEVFTPQSLAGLTLAEGARVAVQTPCTLQHALRLPGRVETLLEAAGVTCTPVAESHLCCGSAGTYSLLQPELSDRLRLRKLANLQAGQPQAIVTANIGCQLHLEQKAGVPVRHWLEYLAEALPPTPGGLGRQ